MTEPVLLDVAEHVATVTLNQPDKRNAMRPELLEAFAAAITRVRRDPSVRVVVVRGSGSTFCSGADFSSGFGAEAPQDIGAIRERLREIYGSFLGLLDVEVPIIAQLNGHAIGGGFGLALACDIRIAAKGAKLGANFVRLGLSPGMAVSYFLPRLIGLPRAAELLFTGRIITAEEAARIGLVNEVVDDAQLERRVQAFAEEIAGAAPIAVRYTKRALYAGLEDEPRRALELEAFAQATTLQTADLREGIAALFEKRAPRFTGS